MRKINLLLVLLFIVGVLSLYYLWNQKDKDQPITKPNETIPEKEVDENLSIQEQLKQNKEDLTNLKEILIERVQAFDPDPAVDAKLIKIKLSHCIKLLNPEKHQEDIKSWKSIDKQSDSQLKYKQDLSLYCEEINNKHPEYLLTKEDDLKVLSDSIKSDSETGKILSLFYNQNINDLESFDMASKIKHLKNANPDLLLDASYYFSSYLVEKLQLDVSEIINSKDNTYISIVRISALDYYACNAGANCGVNSNMMARMCLNRNLCGNDFNDIVNNKMPMGIRSDILKVYEYLKKTFD